MEQVFIQIISIGFSASWLILAVLVLRQFFRNTPKRVLCLLWGLVALRLVCPFSIESRFSLIPESGTGSFVQNQMEGYLSEQSDSSEAISGKETNIRENNIHKTSVANRFSAQWLPLASRIWAAGMIILCLYAVIALFLLQRKVSAAVPVPMQDNVYQGDEIGTPFLMGLLRLRIYLPSDLDKSEMEYVLAHERAHIRHGDPWWKAIGFAFLALYWFHPLVWAAYAGLSKDLELACDEKVISGFDMAEKKAYARTLLSCTTHRHMVFAYPLSFGEVAVKTRIKEILNTKKPAFWGSIGILVVCVIAVACFWTNPVQKSYDIGISIPAQASSTNIYYSDEEISPRSNSLTLWAGENLGDTEITLWSLGENGLEEYKASSYITQGMPVKFEVEKGRWYRIGVVNNGFNASNKEQTVFVHTKNIEVRVQSAEKPAQSTTA